MNRRSRRPPEPKKADRNKERTNHRRRKSFLGLEFTFLIELRLGVMVEVVEEWRDCDGCSDENTKESYTFEGDAEAVYSFEYNGEGFKPDIELGELA